MITILSDGEHGHRLEDADGRHVGSIRHRTIRLVGLGSQEDAVAAAVDVWHVLDASLARHFPGWPRHELALGHVRLVHDGAYEWISDGKRPFARLLRTPADRSPRQTFAIEFVLPSYSSEGVLISSAQLMAKAMEEYLLRSGAGARVPHDELSLGVASA